MKGPTKHLYELERQITYQRHRKRLSEINRQKYKGTQGDSSLQEMHKIRNKSLHFRTVEHDNKLNHQNQRIINSILNIAKRKSSFSQHQPSMVYFNNRVRKRQEREIARTNHILAERILTKQSEFDPNTLKKNIEDYEQRKRIREGKSKISLPLLENLSRVNSVERKRRSRAMFRDSSEAY